MLPIASFRCHALAAWTALGAPSRRPCHVGPTSDAPSPSRAVQGAPRGMIARFHRPRSETRMCAVFSRRLLAVTRTLENVTSGQSATLPDSVTRFRRLGPFRDTMAVRAYEKASKSTARNRSKCSNSLEILTSESGELPAFSLSHPPARTERTKTRRLESPTNSSTYELETDSVLFPPVLPAHGAPPCSIPSVPTSRLQGFRAETSEHGEKTIPTRNPAESFRNTPT